MSVKIKAFLSTVSFLLLSGLSLRISVRSVCNIRNPLGFPTWIFTWDLYALSHFLFPTPFLPFYATVTSPVLVRYDTVVIPILLYTEITCTISPMLLYFHFTKKIIHPFPNFTSLITIIIIIILLNFKDERLGWDESKCIRDLKVIKIEYELKRKWEESRR